MLIWHSGFAVAATIVAPGEPTVAHQATFDTQLGLEEHLPFVLVGAADNHLEHALVGGRLAE